MFVGSEAFGSVSPRTGWFPTGLVRAMKKTPSESDGLSDPQPF